MRGARAPLQRQVDDKKPTPYFVPLTDLEKYGSFPRRGSNDAFTHELTGLANGNLHRAFDTFDAKTTAFVFVSHRWLRPGNGARGHPVRDDPE